MEYKRIPKIVHLHTYNLTDILIDNEHKFCLANENSVISSSFKNRAVRSPRITAKMVASWCALIMMGDKNSP